MHQSSSPRGRGQSSAVPIPCLDVCAQQQYYTRLVFCFETRSTGLNGRILPAGPQTTPHTHTLCSREGWLALQVFPFDGCMPRHDWNLLNVFLSWTSWIRARGCGSHGQTGRAALGHSWARPFHFQALWVTHTVMNRKGPREGRLWG